MGLAQQIGGRKSVLVCRNSSLEPFLALSLWERDFFLRFETLKNWIASPSPLIYFQLVSKKITSKLLYCLSFCVSFKNFLASLFFSLKFEGTVEISKMISSSKVCENRLVKQKGSFFEFSVYYQSISHVQVSEGQICGYVANIK